MAAPVKAVNLVHKAYTVLNHRGEGDSFELEVSRTVRSKEVVAWFNLTAFIKSDGGIDALAYEYIKRKRLVKRSGI